jgi:molybdate/tungstate transport system substrate-binding protein
MFKIIIQTIRCVLILLIVIQLVSCTSGEHKILDKEPNGELVIFHAGSMSKPIKEIVAYFKTKNPNITIFTEAAGSLESARKITELGKSCDVFISADYKVIDNLLIPKFASWNISFASNEMVIAFNENSIYKNEINLNNWFSILNRKDVRVGRSDPNSDPCGYRTVLTTKLAEKYYKMIGLSDKLLSKSKRDIRPKEVDLLALLETNNIDYMFIYRSVALQHNLKFITLPNEINLGSISNDSIYSTVKTSIKGNKPGVFIDQTGEVMQYSITIPNVSKNKKLALTFVHFFLSEKDGMKTIVANGQKSIVPSKSNGYDSIPEILQPFVLKQ